MVDERDREEQELVYFWALGDLHYRDHEQWLAYHTPRMDILFEDLHEVWRDERPPAFCVSPGDIVDDGARANYELARQQLLANLGDVPFYPGIGNHEYHGEFLTQVPHSAQDYIDFWGKPLCYTWHDDAIAYIMLDHPDQYMYTPGYSGDKRAFLSPESLIFLENALTEHTQRLAIIFAHCPLYNTVLDRDPVRDLDEDSLDPFFYIENSSDVRTILARHSNAVLYISGHTHSGWGSPQLVFTETLGDHPVTHLNLMSPWYTGTHAGPRISEDFTRLLYDPDTPDVIITFSVRVYPQKAVIRARDHRARQWIARWDVPTR